MVDRATLEVEARSQTGKTEAKKIRAAGKVPGVVYGLGDKPQPIVLDPAKLRKIYLGDSGRNTLIDLQVAGKSFPVLSHDLEFDPLTRQLLHIDFLRVDLGKAVHQRVPLVLTGTSPGIKAGGILEQNVQSVMITCLPERIPNKLVMDVSNLELGQSRHARDLSLPEGVKLMESSELVLVRVAEPRAEKIEDPAATVATVPAEGAEEGTAAPAAEGTGDAAKGTKEPAAAKGKEPAAEAKTVASAGKAKDSGKKQ